VPSPNFNPQYEFRVEWTTSDGRVMRDDFHPISHGGPALSYRHVCKDPARDAAEFVYTLIAQGCKEVTILNVDRMPRDGERLLIDLV
jgi:hypothetical protein